MFTTEYALFLDNDSIFLHFSPSSFKECQNWEHYVVKFRMKIRIISSQQKATMFELLSLGENVCKKGQSWLKANNLCQAFSIVKTYVGEDCKSFSFKNMYISKESAQNQKNLMRFCQSCKISILVQDLRFLQSLYKMIKISHGFPILQEFRILKFYFILSYAQGGRISIGRRIQQKFWCSQIYYASPSERFFYFFYFF